MYKYLLVSIAALALVACSSVVSPKIDEQTGTTLAQRCVDYRASLAAYDAVRAERELSPEEAAVAAVLKTWVVANCPPVVVAVPEGVVAE